MKGKNKWQFKEIHVDIAQVLIMINEQLKLIGINIKAERLKKNLSQEQLAEMTNISIPTISLIETGKQNTSILNILEIASALGVDVNTLVEGI